MACAPSEDSDQPGHPPSLIRIFAVKKAWVLSYPLSAQRRLWSDWADAQADLSLRWAHMPFCWFCHEVAQMIMSSDPFYTDLTITNFTKMSIKLSMHLINKLFKNWCWFFFPVLLRYEWKKRCAQCMAGVSYIMKVLQLQFMYMGISNVVEYVWLRTKIVYSVSKVWRLSFAGDAKTIQHQNSNQ